MSEILMAAGLAAIVAAGALVLWMIRPRRYRYEVVMLGDPSGVTVTRVTFVRFRHQRQAQAWCDKMNQHRVGATRYTFREIGR